MAAAGSPAPSVLAVTVVRDEAVMLPRWVAHYSRELGGPEHLLVVDDNTTDGSTDDLPCPVLRLPDRPVPNWAVTRLRMLNGLAAGLLEVHDAVLFTDADELVVADPAKYASVRDLVADRPGTDVLGVAAYNVVHHVGVEPALDPARPVLSQRHLAMFVPIMCKPALKRVDEPWRAGSHGIRAPYAVDPDLVMFHLKFADRDHLLASARHRRQLVAEQDRGQDSNWALGEELVGLLDQVSARADTGPLAPFALPEEVRAGVVQRQAGGRGDRPVHRSVGFGQVKAMRKGALAEIPARFRDSC